jgi:hypothetical protein
MSAPLKRLYPIAGFDLYPAALFENYSTTCYLKISVVCQVQEQLSEGIIKPVTVAMTGRCGYRSDSGSSLSKTAKRLVALLMSTYTCDLTWS